MDKQAVKNILAIPGMRRLNIVYLDSDIREGMIGTVVRIDAIECQGKRRLALIFDNGDIISFNELAEARERSTLTLANGKVVSFYELKVHSIMALLDKTLMCTKRELQSDLKVQGRCLFRWCFSVV